jgi:hypothetical protein
MALVPNGRVRIMEKQALLGDWNPAAPEPNIQLAGDEAASGDERSEIQQDKVMPGGEEVPQQKPQGIPQGNDIRPQQAPNAAPAAGMRPPEQAHESGINVDFTDETSAEDFDPDAAKQTYLELLKKNTLLVRQVSRKDENKLFKKNFSSDGVWSGQFFVPGTDETGSKPFGAKAAAKMMMEFCKKFRLKGDMMDEPGGNGHMIKWTTQGKSKIVGPGGAVSDFLNGGGAPGEKKTGGSLTMGEMLKARMNDLYDTMRKIANGVK